MTQLSDSVALVWFLALCVGYRLYTDRCTPREHEFFKCTWNLRQFNYYVVLVGAAPVIGKPHDDARIRRTAWLSTLASKDFNQGLRAYYFGISVIAWFISGWMFMIATAAVVGVLYWREYHSQALRTLELPLTESLAREPTP